MRLASWLLVGGCIAMPGQDPVRVPFTKADTATSGGLTCGTASQQQLTLYLRNELAHEVTVSEVTPQCVEVYVTAVPAFTEIAFTAYVGASLVFRDPYGAVVGTWIVAGDDEIVVIQ